MFQRNSIEFTAFNEMQRNLHFLFISYVVIQINTGSEGLRKYTFSDVFGKTAKTRKSLKNTKNHQIPEP